MVCVLLCWCGGSMSMRLKCLLLMCVLMWNWLCFSVLVNGLKFCLLC